MIRWSIWPHRAARRASSGSARARSISRFTYVAPEQVEGGAVDGLADQYSLGCVLFECLTGMVPFWRDSELAVLWAHVHDPPPRIGDYRPDLPAALDDAIGRALAKAPGDRHPSCGALVAAAQAALAGAAPAGLRHRVGRAVGRRARYRRRPGLTRRSSLVLTIAAAVLSAVLLAAAVVLARDRGAPPGPATPSVVLAANRAVRIDPATYEPEAAVAVGTDPSAVIGRSGCATRRPGWPSPRTERRSGRPPPPTGPSAASTLARAAWSSRSRSQRPRNRRHTGTGPSG